MAIDEEWMPNKIQEGLFNVLNFLRANCTPEFEQKLFDELAKREEFYEKQYPKYGLRAGLYQKAPLPEPNADKEGCLVVFTFGSGDNTNKEMRMAHSYFAAVNDSGQFAQLFEYIDPLAPH